MLLQPSRGHAYTNNEPWWDRQCELAKRYDGLVYLITIMTAGTTLSYRMHLKPGVHKKTCIMKYEKKSSCFCQT